MVTKNNIGPHQGTATNPLSFDAAYRLLTANPNNQYQTTGNNSAFIAIATTGKRGAHEGERVIIFKSNGVEMARAYECCWGYQTNCNNAYIDCYTQAIA
jgi:hypothetical protein